MGDKTTIGWTESTWNPIRGCQRTAPAGSKQSGCGDPSGGGCYAERQAARFCGEGMPYEGLIKLTANGPRWTGKTRFVANHLMDPIRWRRPRKIFTDSMSDLFYEGVPTDWVDQIVAVMMICCLRGDYGNHVFQTLTKRPARMREYFADPKAQERVARAAGALMEDGDGWFDTIAFRKEGLLHPNMWWGTSVENQAAANERIPELLATTAEVRFLSVEPLLGPVDLTLPNTWLVGAIARKILRDTGAVGPVPRHLQPPPTLDWVIVGCESGRRARACEVEWIRSLRDQCAHAGVAFFLKQAEESVDDDNLDGTLESPIECMPEDGKPEPQIGEIVACDRKANRPGGNTIIERPFLDSRQHLAFPEVKPCE